jgi:hypothetical protein
MRCGQRGKERVERVAAGPSERMIVGPETFFSWTMGQIMHRALSTARPSGNVFCQVPRAAHHVIALSQRGDELITRRVLLLPLEASAQKTNDATDLP